MALTVLDDFESGTIDDGYTGASGSGWGISTFNRVNGFQPPTYRPLPDATNLVPDHLNGGNQALRFHGRSAFALSALYDNADGMGGVFYSDASPAGGAEPLGTQVTITWAGTETSGSFYFRRYGHVLEIRETYLSDDTIVNDSTVTLTDFDGGDGNGAWLDASFSRFNGWTILNGRTGATIAHSDYAFNVPTGASWNLDFLPNLEGPLDFAGSLNCAVDYLYAWPAGRPVIRLFPRSDGRGMSSAPRIHPAPSSQRVIGGHQ